MSQLLSAVVAVILGVGGVMVMYWALNAGVQRLPGTWEHRLRPYVFVGPAFLVVGIYLLFPALDTLRLSFFDVRADEFVGLANYEFVARDASIRQAILNNVLWIIVVPAVSVAIGLAVAVLADKLQPRWESVSKSLIFLPMAISFVGASTIWMFVYAWRTPGTSQIGLLNAVWTTFGGDPIPWLQDTRFNDFALMFIMIWLQAGFAMVLLSAAIKSVPEETLEAARIDGASEMQVFWRVVLPQIRSTIVVVGTTILILVMKVFDIVYVTTNGNFGTDVVVNRFIREMFNFGRHGVASVLVVLLIVATIPFMIVNVRRFREQEATR